MAEPLQEIILTRFPIGPSVNGLYLSSRGRLIKSQAGRIYQGAVESYRLKNWRVLEQAEQALAGQLLRLDRYFVFHRKRLVCKGGQVKRLDVENYLKSTMDGLATALGIDDKFFRSGVVEALSCEREQDEQLIVRITPHQARSLTDLQAALGLRPAVVNLSI